MWVRVGFVRVWLALVSMTGEEWLLCRNAVRKMSVELPPPPVAPGVIRASRVLPRLCREEEAHDWVVLLRVCSADCCRPSNVRAITHFLCIG